MGEQQRIDPANRNAEMKQSHGSASAGIDQYSVTAGFDQRARAKTIGTGNWRPRPEERHAKI
ncbi:hypothetical protein [Bradyrhizobium sp. WSM1417]|uniref:hypothetical protein n=1 Tax=Bradyrhizobium sp. WSM1417 TaxID=754500 RepID=UPI001FD8BA39|nr:hypothetical protein [Bradyrhizobium sp. WSM1417]